jgi:hypothetical protein
MSVIGRRSVRSRGGPVLALVALCAFAWSGCGSGGASSTGGVPRSTAGVQVTLAAFENDLRAKRFSDACRRYFTARANGSIKAKSGRDCVTALAREFSGETILDLGRPMHPISVSGNRATVVIVGGEDELRDKMVYLEGQWKFE